MNSLLGTIVIAALTAAGAIFGHAANGLTGEAIGLAVAAVFAVSSYWFGLDVAVGTHRAEPIDAADPRWRLVAEIVSGLSARAGIPPPTVFRYASAEANCFTAGPTLRRSGILIAEPMVEMLSREELVGVFAHEIAHIRNRDPVLMSIVTAISALILSIGGAIALVGYASRKHGQLAKPIGIGIGVLTLALQAVVSRSREYGADREGAAICGNPLWIAAALRKLAGQSPTGAGLPAFAGSQFVSLEWVRLLNTHPEIDERIRRLEAMARTC